MEAEAASEMAWDAFQQTRGGWLAAAQTNGLARRPKLVYVLVITCAKVYEIPPGEMEKESERLNVRGIHV